MHPNAGPEVKNAIPLGIWLICAALVLFLVGTLAPSVLVNEFGNARRLSLLGGIHVLWTTGHTFLALLIFLFTILFPPAKLAVICVVGIPSIPLTQSVRRRLRKIIEHLGRWSLLDVLVIAILIVTIKVQGFVSVKADWGIYAFTFSIVLSMLATHFLEGEISNVPALPTNGNIGAKHKPSQLARNCHSTTRMAAAFVLTLCGVGWFICAPAGNVGQVHVTRKETFIEIPRFFGNPAFYIQVRTLEGVQRLDTKPRSPIGNGLMWTLEQPVLLANVYEVEIFEDGLLSDKLVDRVSVNGRRAIGQRFQFELKGRIDWQRPTALATALIGPSLLLLVTSRRNKTLKQFPQFTNQEGS